MELNDTDLDHLTATAMTAAALAASHIQAESERKFEVFHKEGGNTEASQALTEVDLASEKIILEALRPDTENYELGVLTEETEDDSSRHQADYFWCIDPIDGTLPFIKGEPGYSVVIALVSREGVAQIGVVWDVVANVPYHARRGLGAFRAGDSIEPAVPGSPETLSWFMDRSMVAQDNYGDWLSALTALAQSKGLKGVEVINHAGAALNASWATANAPAVYFKCPKEKEGGGSVWDFAATSCFYETLGLPVSDMFGKRLNLNPAGPTFMNRSGVLYASSPEWANEVRKIYGELR
ncbi:MAG: hypothetical protein P1U68_08840 [Verrucomicrobiales bacterium]|nr:hypothetical protein [Verrucomicrobiales bacterium]